MERIPFDGKSLLLKLTEFFGKCLAPEIISPVHSLGLPVRDLRDKRLILLFDLFMLTFLKKCLQTVNERGRERKRTLITVAT